MVSVSPVRQPSILIVGGGPAGAATAIGLARAGERPLLLEREREPADHLCGGFLSWTALARLERLGVSAIALGAHPITRVVLFAKGREVGAYLPAPAASLSRGTLDRALLEHAADLGAIICRGVRVRCLSPTGARLADGAEIAAERVVLASGKHDVPGIARGDIGPDPVVGLRWKLGASAALTRRLAGRIELYAFDGGYAGLALQEGNVANLCLAVRQSRFDAAGKSIEAVLEALVRQSPALASRLDDAAWVTQCGAVARVPYGWRLRAGSGPAIHRVGDQAGVIASLAGEGISLALAGGFAAARSLLTGEDPQRFQANLARRLDRPIVLAQQVMRMIEHPAAVSALLGAASLMPVTIGLCARATRLAA